MFVGYRSRGATQGSNISGEFSSQLEASISRCVSPTPRWRIQGASLPTKKNICSSRQEIRHYHSSVPQADLHHDLSTLKRHSDLPDVGILHSPCSSETEDEGFPSSDKMDGHSIAIGTCKGVHVTYLSRHQGRSESKGLSKIMDGSTIKPGHLVPELNLEHRDDAAAHNCSSVQLTMEEENSTFQPSSEKPLVISDDNTLGISCSTAHQFPYKKRKFDATSFSNFAEANECTSSRNSKLV